MYIYRKKCYAESLQKENDYNMRHSRFNSLDMYEYMRTDIEIQMIDEITTEIFNVVINCK